MSLHDFFTLLAMTGGYLLMIIGVIVIARGLSDGD